MLRVLLQPWIYFKIVNQNFDFETITEETVTLLQNDDFIEHVCRYYNNIKVVSALSERHMGAFIEKPKYL